MAYTTNKYMAVVENECSPEDWLAIVRRAIDDAKDGDAAARQWLTGLSLVPPPTRYQYPTGGVAKPCLFQLTSDVRCELLLGHDGLHLGGR